MLLSVFPSVCLLLSLPKEVAFVASNNLMQFLPTDSTKYDVHGMNSLRKLLNLLKLIGPSNFDILNPQVSTVYN